MLFTFQTEKIISSKFKVLEKPKLDHKLSSPGKSAVSQSKLVVQTCNRGKIGNRWPDKSIQLVERAGEHATGGKTPGELEYSHIHIGYGLPLTGYFKRLCSKQGLDTSETEYSRSSSNYVVRHFQD